GSMWMIPPRASSASPPESAANSGAALSARFMRSEAVPIRKLDIAGEFGVEMLAPDELQEGAPRVGVGEHHTGADLLAALETDTLCLAAVHQHLGDRRRGADLDAVRPRRRRHRLAHRAHAAARDAPFGAHAIPFFLNVQAGEVAADAVRRPDP